MHDIFVWDDVEKGLVFRTGSCGFGCCDGVR